MRPGTKVLGSPAAPSWISRSAVSAVSDQSGNSSSGLIEAPSLGLPVVNVGSRQKGRIRASNVIDVGNGVEQIREGISRALSPAFRKSLEGLENPYDRFRDGTTSKRIKDTLKRIPSAKSLIKKEFRDLA